MSTDTPAQDPAGTASLDEIDALLTPLQEVLALDGGTLDVVEVDGEVLHLRLTLAPDACQECIVPDALIQDMVLDRLTALSGGRPERVEVAHS